MPTLRARAKLFLPLRSWRLQVAGAAIAIVAAVLSAQSFASAREAVASYLIRRLLLMILTLFGISVIIFVLLRVVPGNIADILFDAAGMVSQADKHKLEVELGLDKPIAVPGEKGTAWKFVNFKHPMLKKFGDWDQAGVSFMRHPRPVMVAQYPVRPASGGQALFILGDQLRQTFGMPRRP